MKNRLSVSGCLTALFAISMLACSAEATDPRTPGEGSGGGGGVPGGGLPGTAGMFGFSGSGSGVSGSNSFGGAPGPGGGSQGFSGSMGTAGAGTGPATMCPSAPGKAGKVDDLEDGENGILLPFQGYWYAYNDKSGTQMPVPDPSGATPFAPTAGGSTATPMFAACTKGAGFTMWGAGIGFNIMDLGMGKSCALDLSGTTGVKFNAKGTGSVRLQVSTTATALPASGGTCALASGCDYHANAPLTLTPTWSQVTVLWSQLSPGGAPFLPSGVLALQFQAFSPMFMGTGAVPAFSFDFCVDDIEFI